jgi:hypothetical protein
VQARWACGGGQRALLIRASGVDVMQDVKELIGIIMRVLDHAEIAEAEVLDLDFEAEGELLAALNDAYIKLLEFAYDRDLRRANPDLDRKERSVLQDSLNKIVQVCDADRIDHCCR